MIVSRNVVYKNLENILKADVIEIRYRLQKIQKFLCIIQKKVNINKYKIKWE